MRHIVLTIDALYTNAAAVDLVFITDDDAKMLKNPTFFAYNGLPLGGYRPVSYIYRNPSPS